jgi:hypothetical protein
MVWLLVADQELWKQETKAYWWRNFGGLNIELPFEQHYNPYIDSDKT